MVGRRPASRVGRRGEAAAARYLKARGYAIVARNLHVGVGEADLVCVSPDGQTVVVVEVKARRSSTGDRRPESQVGVAKQRKLRQVAEAVGRMVAKRDPSLRRGLRIDVVAVELRGWFRGCQVRHHEGAVSWSRRP